MADRHQFRADWYDYRDGIYFVTLCCMNRTCYFGEITKGALDKTPIGIIARKLLDAIPQHHPYAEVINAVVMPNHVHMVISLTGTRHISSANQGCLHMPAHGPGCEDRHHNSALAVVVGTYKAAVSRAVRRLGPAYSDIRIWQSRYHEHIIRNQRSYENIMNYIDNNIANWNVDCFNPHTGR